MNHPSTPDQQQPLQSGSARRFGLLMLLSLLLCMLFTPRADAATAQSISFSALSNKTYTGNPFTISATDSASLPITYASTTPTICSVAATGVSGNISYGSLTMLGAGTCSISADQPGNATYSAAPQIVQSFTINPTTGAILFNPLANQSVSAAPFIVSAASYCGLPVTLTSTTPSVCTVAAKTVTLVGAGTCSLTASQPGNSGCSTAPQLTQSFAVTAYPAPTVSLTSPTTGLTTLAGIPITVAANVTDPGGTIAQVRFTANSGATVIGTATTAPYSVNWTGAIGSYNIVATATNTAGVSTVSASTSVLINLNPNLTPQSISFILPNSTPMGAPLTISGTSGSGLPVRFDSLTPQVCSVSGNTVTPLTTGTCSITANQPGNATYLPSAQLTRTMTITAAVKTSQSISFAALPNKNIGNPAFSVSATATSGLPVSFSSQTTPVCTISGNTITLVTTGTCSIAADQPGNTSTNAAPQVVQSFTVSAPAPSVSVTSPTNGQSISAGSNVTFSASASVTGSTITQVDYYNGPAFIGSATVSPYSINWSNIPAGSYSITAKATSAAGPSTVSTPVTFTVTAGKAPVVTLTAPANGSSIAGPVDVPLTATASESGGSIAQVSFYSDGVLVGSATQAPYTVTLPHAAIGTHVIIAKATDAAGVSTTSAANTVTVKSNPALTISLASSASTGVAPAAITLTATAADTAGTITQVQFFNGATALATVTKAPYTYAWKAIAAGEYSVTAVVTDNTGATTTSTAQTVVISDTAVAGAWKTYYVQTDQLNTPRMITDATNKVVWQWDNAEPFGNNLPNQDPSGTGNQFVFNLRFPGQYADAETGIFYNWHRYYNPVTGTYIQSDPLGLGGGTLSTYAYVGGNPLSRTDPTGLFLNPVTERAITEALIRVGVTVARGGGPENPITDVVAVSRLTSDLIDLFNITSEGVSTGSGPSYNVSKRSGSGSSQQCTPNNLSGKLYHYTSEAGMIGILNSQSLNPSLKAINPNDVRYGNGQYLSDIEPGTMTPNQLSRAFINNPFQGSRYSNFIEIDISGLNVIEGRPGVYVVPNEISLDLTDRITNSGKVPK